jgi:hypothetical protein
MKTVMQTANVEGETISLQEVMPFWFAVSSALLGALLGLLGAVVCYLGERVTRSQKSRRFNKS